MAHSCCAAARAPATAAGMLRFLVAMAALRTGELREAGRVRRNGRRFVRLVEPGARWPHEVEDPGLGEREAAAVDELLRLLGG